MHCQAELYAVLQIGATVGNSEYRVQAAEALIAAMKSSAAASPEIIEMILQVGLSCHPDLPVSVHWQE